MRIARLVVTFGLVVLVPGCRKEPPVSSPPIENRSDAAAAVTAPAPDAGADPCVADCVAKNQMRATSPEQIEAGCRAECAGASPP